MNATPHMMLHTQPTKKIGKVMICATPTPKLMQKTSNELVPFRYGVPQQRKLNAPRIVPDKIKKHTLPQLVFLSVKLQTSGPETNILIN